MRRSSKAQGYYSHQGDGASKIFVQLVQDAVVVRQSVVVVRWDVVVMRRHVWVVRQEVAPDGKPASAACAIGP